MREFYIETILLFVIVVFWCSDGVKRWRMVNDSVYCNIVSRIWGIRKESVTLHERREYIRSQAVARIADRTASQHLQGSRDVIGYLTILYTICHFLLVVLWNQASISNGFRDIQHWMSPNGWHDLDMTSKQKSRSFILIPTDFSYTSTSYRLSIITFALGRTI